MNDDIIEWNESMLLEVEFDDPDTFLSIIETLTRIGIANSKTKSLFQSCHLLHKRGRYFLMHFKELYILDGKPSNLQLEDIQRRDTIAKLLESWGLLRICDSTNIHRYNVFFKVVKHCDKDKWTLVPKYNIGVK